MLKHEQRTLAGMIMTQHRLGPVAMPPSKPREHGVWMADAWELARASRAPAGARPLVGGVDAWWLSGGSRSPRPASPPASFQRTSGSPIHGPACVLSTTL